MAMFAIGVAAATAQVATMNLSGSVPAEMNGKKMYIINLDTRERIDSAVVKNGKLVFATEVGAGEAVPAAIAEGSKRRLSFILEPGTATINDRGQVKGTRLNNIVEGVGDMLDSLTVDYKARQKQIMQSQMSNDEKMKAPRRFTTMWRRRAATSLWKHIRQTRQTPRDTCCSCRLPTV